MRAALARLRPRPNWVLGAPQRATLAAVEPTGYILLVDYANGRDWVDLPGQRRGDDWTALSADADDRRPSEADLAAVDAELAARRLARTQGWGVDAQGRLYAPVGTLRPRLDNGK